MRNIVISASMCLVLVACAGREAKQVEVVKDTDFGKTCEELTVEAKTNDFQIKTLITENSKRHAGNTAAVVASVVFLPALFALDLKGAAKAEYETLIRRNTHLASVAKSKNCEPIPIKTFEEYKKEIAAERKAKMAGGAHSSSSENLQ